MAHDEYSIVQVDAKQFIATVKQLPFTTKQLNLLLSRTPERHIKERPIPGGGTAKYVSVQYMINTLNLITGFRWSFDVLDEKEQHGQIVVKGQLTVVFKDGTELVKTQFGRAFLKMSRGTPKEVIDYGNDFKAAASDALKKCASLLGIAWDVYSSDEMNEIQIVDSQVNDRNKTLKTVEVLTTPIEEVKARVTKKLEKMPTVERLRALKSTGHTDIKKLSDSNWRRLDSGLSSKEGKTNDKA